MLMRNRLKLRAAVLISVLFLISCSNIPDYISEALKKDVPAVSFTNLVNTQIINSPIIINGRSSDNKGISSVKIMIDSSEYDAEQNPDWNTWSFDLTGVVMTTGEHHITAVAVNMDGAEGSATVVVYYNDGIDLEPVKVDVTDTTVNRQSLVLAGTVKVDVRNNSNYTVSNNYRVALFEDSNFNALYDSGTDRILGYADVSAGHSSLTTRTVDIDVNLPVLFADNLIYALVDSNDSVMETSEINNSINNMTGVEFIPPVGGFNPVIEWQWTESTTNTASNQVMCSPVVAPLIDTNGDGIISSNDVPYIIFNTFEGSVYTSNGTLRAIRGDGTGELFSVTGYDTHPVSNPAVGDIDNDGRPDVLVISESYRLMAFNNDGTHKWTSAVTISPSASWQSVTIADLDEDGTAEIIIGDNVFNNDGSSRWMGGNSTTMGSLTSCVAKLISGDHPYLIAGNSAYHFDGSLYWRKDIALNGFSAVGDLNLDGFPEIVIVSSNSVWLLKYDGSILWGPVLLPSFVYQAGGGAPTIADVNGDGIPEIGIACSERFVVLDSTGNLLWSKVTLDTSSRVTGSSVFDFEGDGNTELIYADENFLRIYNGIDGSELFKLPVGSGTALEIPVIVDVDNDNKAEIVCVANNYRNGIDKQGILVIGDANDTWVNTRKIWNQHSYHITNVNDDATIPQYETNNWSIYNNYRQNQLMNPFEAFDLSSSYLRVDQSGFPGSVTITARIGNSGALAIGNSIFVAFYDGNPETGGTLIGIREIITRMEPGTFVDVNLLWNTPSGGTHNIYVVADDDGAGHTRLREISELNNVIYNNVEF
jgi:hypothetical protein